MKIYVDFDDCICETARYFSGQVFELFGKKVPYEQMHSFDLKTSFGLTEEQYEYLLMKAHEPEVLLAYEETPGATAVLLEWLGKGYDVSVITGRPFSTYETSRAWLDGHGLQDLSLCCLDKYGREKHAGSSRYCLKAEEYRRMEFDYAVEDSPLAFSLFDHSPKLKVMVFDRPWNREHRFPNDNYHRCYDWESIRERIAE